MGGEKTIGQNKILVPCTVIQTLANCTTVASIAVFLKVNVFVECYLVTIVISLRV